MRKCRDCGIVLPPHTGRGRPRARCAECAPPRHRNPRPAVVALVVDVPPADIVEAVARELEAKGRQHTSGGMAALILARRLLDSQQEPGTAAAALAKQLEVSLASALAGTVEEDVDELDALRKRRGG